MWSPLCAKFWNVYDNAAAPEATANAATPPSRAAILCSNTSSVGFVNLPYILPESLNPNLAAA